MSVVCVNSCTRNLTVTLLESFRDMIQPIVLSDPMAELPRRTVKYAQQCTELHLGGKGITKIVGFETFDSLESLWLNNNKIVELSGLQNNFRLKFLYLQHNSIRSIDGAFVPFTFLNTLTLNNNNLDNLEEVLEELKYLRHLEYLDLYHCPISQEDNYRLRVIAQLPWLKILDKHTVTEIERKDAISFKKKEKRAFKMPEASTKKYSKAEQELESAQILQMKRIYRQIKKFVLEKRLLLEDPFLDYDLRRLGHVPKEVFLQVLTVNGVVGQLTSEELELVLSECTVEFLPLENMNLTTFSKSTLKLSAVRKEMISYVKFCAQAVPKELKRPLPKFLSKQSKLLRAKSPETNESATVSDLHRFASSVRQRLREEEEEARRRAILMNAATLPPSATSDEASTFLRRRGDQTYADRLDPWAAAEVTKIIHNLIMSVSPAAPNFNMDITAEQLRAILQQISSKLGKVPVLLPHPSGDNVTPEEYILGGNDGTLSVRDLCSVLGCHVPVQPTRSGLPMTPQPRAPMVKQHTIIRSPSKDMGGVSANAGSSMGDSGGASGGARLARGTSVGTIQQQRERMKRLQWRDVTSTEAYELQEKAATDAHHSLERLLRAPKDADLTPFKTQAMSSGIIATKFNNYLSGGSRIGEGDVGQTKNPVEVITKAPNRADVFVLPSLYTTAARKLETQGEGYCTAKDWSQSIRSLGLKGSALQVAVERKLRSQSAEITKGETRESGRKSGGSAPHSHSTSKARWTETTATIVI